jgi:hypothetical protein
MKNTNHKNKEMKQKGGKERVVIIHRIWLKEKGSHQFRRKSGARGVANTE